MSLTIPDFWKLVLESKLLTRAQCQPLATSYGSSQGATADPHVLAQWLVSQNVLSRYQATILLAGRPGPFVYGEYKIYDRLETGRLAGWFRAVHVGTNHPVMLKFLAGAAAQNAQLWNYIASSLPVTVHPQLVRFYEAVDLRSYKFLVVEDLRGQTLAERLQASGPFPADEACRLAQLTALGLGHLHQLGRPHGDTRPTNMWLTPQGNVKLLYEPDVLTAAPNFAQPESQGELLGRADYLAPEFLQAGKTPDHLTDIYALGCSLYELISRQPPFAGGTLPAKMQRHATEAIQPLDAFGAAPHVGQAVAYMMAKNPAVRYQQAAAVAEQLGQFVGQAKSNYQPTPAPPTGQSYETWLLQKQTAPVAALAPTAVSVPAMGSEINIATPASPSRSGINIAKPTGAVELPSVGKPPSKAKASGGSSLTAARQARAKSRQKNNLIMFGSAIGVTAVLLIIGVIVLTRSGNKDTAPPAPEPIAQIDPTPSPVVPVEETSEPGTAKGEVAADRSGRGEIVADDGQLLWASPTQGAPITLKYVPNGARVLLMVRPAEMLAQPEGERVLKALGPDFQAARAAWEATAGIALSDIERLTVALYPNEGQTPKSCSVVQLRGPMEPDALLAKWGNPAAVEGLNSVFQKGETAYFIPGDAGRLVFVMGPLETEIRDVAGGTPLLMQRELGRLLQASDDQRHATILFARDFFRGDGKLLFSGSRQRALDQVEWFMGDGFKAGLLGLHFGEPFYFELRAQNDITIDPVTLATNLRSRTDQIPELIEEYLITLNPPTYWARMKARMRDMVYELHARTRSGVDGDQAMINGVLPGVAAHNLAFGGEMLLALTPGGMASTTVATAAPPTGPKNIEEVLKSKVTLSFGEFDLNLAMQEAEKTVKTEFPSLPFDFKIKIIGPDLQLDGITRNQKVREFDMQGATVADVLTAMVRKANPVTTVKDPSEKDQKLLWVVAPDPDAPANQVVLITTRQVAEQKYTLPEVFRTK